MPSLKTSALLALPIAATLISTSIASADHLAAYIKGDGLSDGTQSFNCSLVGSRGTRAHIQAFAFGEDIYKAQTWTAYSVQSGVSGDTRLGYPGKRHRVELQSHLIDTGVGIESRITHCSGAWTTGWQSSGSPLANVSGCSANVYASSGPSGACVTRSFSAGSFANTNP